MGASVAWRRASATISVAAVAGRLTARERIVRLLDGGSFQESGARVKAGEAACGVLGEGVITGYGKVDGRHVCVYSQDAAVKGGSLSAAHARKICRLMDSAMAAGVPIIGLNDSGGARIQDGVEALAGYADIFSRNVAASGAIPQISVIMGSCAGGAAYSPALTDFVFMVENSSCLFVTGPRVVEQVTGESVTKAQLGGAHTHTARSGVAHLSFSSDSAALSGVRQLLGYLPSCAGAGPPPRGESRDPLSRTCGTLENIIPKFAVKSYDMREVIAAVADDGVFFPVHTFFARNILTGFARLGNTTVGVVANQPLEMAGVLDGDACNKAARFVRCCDAFGIPLITLVDVPGFLPGMEQEHTGIVRHGAKLIYAYAEATVPKIAVVLRKAYGGAYCVMSSKQLRGDLNYAWPSAEIAVMGAKGASEILYGKKRRRGADLYQEEVDYQSQFCNADGAAQHGYLDDVIPPGSTREVLCRGLEYLARKSVSRARVHEPLPGKKHGNIPL